MLRSTPRKDQTRRELDLSLSSSVLAELSSDTMSLAYTEGIYIKQTHWPLSSLTASSPLTFFIHTITWGTTFQSHIPDVITRNCTTSKFTNRTSQPLCCPPSSFTQVAHHHTLHLLKSTYPLTPTPFSIYQGFLVFTFFLMHLRYHGLGL